MSQDNDSLDIPADEFTQHNQQEKLRYGKHRLGKAHEDGIHPASEKSRQAANERSQRDGDDDRGDAHKQRNLTTVDDTGKNVAPGGARAHDELAVGGAHTGLQVNRIGFIFADINGTYDDEENNQTETDHAQNRHAVSSKSPPYQLAGCQDLSSNAFRRKSLRIEGSNIRCHDTLSINPDGCGDRQKCKGCQ